MKPTLGSQSGMTLLEIMVVIVIMGLIAGLVGVAVIDQLDEAKKRTAKTQIADFGQALDLYKLDFGNYPTSSEGLGVLVRPGNNKKPYMKSTPKDPWNKDYVYISPGSHNSTTYDLQSYGADGADGGGDDINNWDEGTNEKN